MIDSMRRYNEHMKQLKRGKIIAPVTVFNIKRIAHLIPVPKIGVDEVRPMSLKQIKKRDPDAMRDDSKQYYKTPNGKPKMLIWKAYGKNTPPERVSRIIA